MLRLRRMSIAVTMAGALMAPAGAMPHEPSFGTAIDLVSAAALPVEAVTTRGGVVAALPSPLRAGELRSADRLLAAVADDLRRAGEAVVLPGNIDVDGTEQGSEANTLPLGDLDGDGIADVGILDLTLPDNELRLRAVRGRDARQLWSVPVDGTGLLAAGRDLTGDGTADLVAFSVPRYDVLVEDCPTERPECDRFLAEFEWRVGVLSGGDLAPVWTSSWVGRAEEVYEEEVTLTATTTHYRSQLTNGYVLPSVVSRPEGPAVLVDAREVVEEWTSVDSTVPVVQPDTYTARVRSRDHISVRQGSDGALLDGTIVGPVTGSSTLAWINDLDRDGFDDVVLESRIQTDTDLECRDLVVRSDCEGQRGIPDHVVSMVDGESFAQKWAHSSTGDDGSSLLLDADVDGDGTRDVAHRWIDRGETAADDQHGTAVLSGASGQRLWAHGSGDGLVGLGDVDGDGRDDLLATRVVTLVPGSRIELRRLRGRDGVELARTEHVFGQDGGVELGYAYRTSDQDADAVRDVAVGRVTFRVESRPDGTVVSVPNRSTAVLESGREARQLWTTTAAGARVLTPVGRLLGHAAVDYDWTGVDGTHVDAQVLRGRDGGRLWQRLVAAEAGRVTGVRDLDADGRDDVTFVYDVREGDYRRSRVLALRGIDGVERWAVSSGP